MPGGQYRFCLIRLELKKAERIYSQQQSRKTAQKSKKQQIVYFQDKYPLKVIYGLLKLVF